MGFTIDEKKVRRAGLDYWPAVTLKEHDSFDAFLSAVQPPQCWFIETSGESYPWQVSFGPSDALVFGSETKGLSAELLSKFPVEQVVRLPMRSTAVRSLNLSNTVAAVAYEGFRQNEGYFLSNTDFKTC